ncbi:Hypp5359 [Branchiostoma lanceolatum]|uniref:Hypp5359 protein n=1 Tax=Branchiostoma lanceolatum TaxID=7740 RepID=A0A8K0AET5_BRALA|nr:Hypp5359 [Branchiostoma lanceolatum]
MAHVLTKEELEKISSALGQEVATRHPFRSSLPAMFYQMKHFLESKLPRDSDIMFAVDQWPDYTAIFARYSNKKAVQGSSTQENGDYLTYYWKEGGRGEDGLRTLLRDDKLVDWTKLSVLIAFPASGVTILQEHWEKKEVTLKLKQYVTAFYPHKVVPEFERHGWKPLSLDGYENVRGRELWVHCPRAQGKGYAMMAGTYYTKKCLEGGYLPFAYMEKNNEIAKKVSIKLGWVIYERGDCVSGLVTK